jgi:hypothetical protein
MVGNAEKFNKVVLFVDQSERGKLLSTSQQSLFILSSFLQPFPHPHHLPLQ